MNGLPLAATSVQRCWAHAVCNVTDKVRKRDQKAVKKDLRKIYTAGTRADARSAARRFSERWESAYPSAVKCLRNDLDELLAFYRFTDPKWRKRTRTTNAIERRFREVRRRRRPRAEPICSDFGSTSAPGGDFAICVSAFTADSRRGGWHIACL